MSKQITANSEAIIHLTIKLLDGSVADSSKATNLPQRIELGNDSLTPAIEKNLIGMQEGESKSFQLTPEESFGMPNPLNIHRLDKNNFADDKLKVNQIFSFDMPDGKQMPGVIRSIDADTVVVDFNHPLCGQDVIFNVEVLSIAPHSELTLKKYQGAMDALGSF
jgi:FKBP-type peptidyl-prolyl cis-trans isomerase SlpA